MNRLSTQVFVVTAGVAIVASILTGMLVRNRTLDAVESAAQEDLVTDSLIFTEVQSYPFFNGSWDGVEIVVDSLASDLDRRIAVTTLTGNILADSSRGEPLPDEPSALLSVEGIEGFDEAVFDDCLLEFGVDPRDLDQVFDGFIVETGTDVADLDECFERSTLDAQPSALLFLGFPSDTSVNLGDLNLETLLLGTLGVVAISGAAAVVLARRVSQPVEALTSAAGQLGQGDLSQRVPAGAAGEVGELATAFNAMAGRLESTEEARARMVGDISHELRNPIGVLQGNLEAAQDGLFPMDVTLIDTLHSETRHLANLVGDLQQLAESDAATLRMQPSDADLAHLAAEAVAGQSHFNPNITVNLDTTPTPVTVDITRMRQVISNLVSNALTHTPDGGSVTVSVHQTSAGAVLSVSDSGVGIDPEHLPLVFERFWRADASRTRATGGSGLGLAICKAIVDAHGGTIEVQSNLGEGTIFTVIL